MRSVRSLRFSATLVMAAGLGTLLVAPPTARAQGAVAGRDSMVQRELENGLRILVLRDPAAAKIVAGLWLEAGWVHNPRGKEGLADIAATLDHMRVRQAVENGQFGKAYLLADLTTDVSTDQTVFAATALPEDLDPLLVVLRAAIPAPDEPFLSAPGLKREVLLKLLQTRTAAGLVAREALAAVLFGDRRPLGFSARFQTLLGVFPDDVRSFHRDFYRPANAVLAVSGPIDADTVLDTARRHFADWPVGAAGVPTWGHAAELPARPGVTLIDDPDSPAALIVGGITGPGREDPAFLDMQLLNQVLGSQRIEGTIAALAASHPAGYQYRTQLRASARGSELTVEVAVAADLAPRALAELERAIAELARGTEPAAFAEAVKARAASLALRYESPETRMREAVSLILAGQPTAAVENPAAALAALDREQVTARWRELLAASRFVWVVHGQGDILAPGLAAAGVTAARSDVFSVITGRLLTPPPEPPLTEPSAAATAQAEELLFAAIEAKGGFENLERVTSYALAETLFVRPGAEMAVGERQLTVEFPDRMREELRLGPLQGRGLIQVVNGTRVWRAQLGKSVETAEWRRQDLLGRVWLDGFRAFYRYAEPGASIFIVDPDAIAGVTMDGFQITSREGYWARYHLHPQSRLVVKRETSRPIEGGSAAIEELFTDYRAVEGVFVPFISATYMDGDYSGESRIFSIELNPELESDLFAPPQ